MLELDDDLLDHLASVRGHYVLCFQDAIAKVQERTGHAAGRVLIEGTLRTDDRALGHLIDLCEVRDDGTIQPIHVLHRSFVPWRGVSYPLGDATLTVHELVWFAVKVIVAPVVELAPVTAWFARWHGEGFEVERPLGGHVHFMSAEELEDAIGLNLDLGSAPVEALRDLIERCVDAGGRRIYLGSGPEALAGDSPA